MSALAEFGVDRGVGSGGVGEQADLTGVLTSPEDRGEFSVELDYGWSGSIRPRLPMMVVEPRELVIDFLREDSRQDVTVTQTSLELARVQELVLIGAGAVETRRRRPGAPGRLRRNETVVDEYPLPQWPHSTSKRSAFITLFQALTKSATNFSSLSSCAYSSE